MKPNIKYPTARRYILSYKAKDDQINCYEVSQPITDSSENITVFSFNRGGIRQFKKRNIVSLKEIKVKEVII